MKLLSPLSGIAGFLMIIFLLLSGCLNKPENQTLKPQLATPSENTYKPWAYWWWMGNSVTREGIRKNLQEYNKAGFGGMHIIPIYGEKGDEENFIPFLSDDFMQIIAYTVKEAENLGMGIDMSMGTGWPFGGPEIDFTHSAKTMLIKKVDLNTIQNIGEITRDIKGGRLVSLSAFDPSQKPVDITQLIQENGDIHTDHGYHEAYALIMRPTRQKVKRAAPGGEGLVIDYFNNESLQHYFRKFQTAFDTTRFADEKIRALYNDSYEVYGANFTTGFTEKFKTLRSYDMTDYLHILADTAGNEIKQRIISDYSETLSDLLLTEFTLPWSNLCNQVSTITRNQAHGSPGNILDLYAACDIPETESFGVSNFSLPGLRKDSDFEEERFGRPNPLTMKFASSAAHIKGKILVSSETATWLGDHFKVALSQIKPQIDELFTAGINHIFYHGITYNPPEKPFPGRLFYASTNFGTRSHFWQELPALNKYVERCQTHLQNSKPDNDILLYFPIHDIWAEKNTEELLVRFDVHHSDKWLKESKFGEIAASLWQSGYSFDYLSDNMLAEAKANQGLIQFNENQYKAIIVPNTSFMPENTLKKLWELAKKGVCIIFQEDLPGSVPGFYNYKKREENLNRLKSKIESRVRISSNVISELQKAGIKNEELASLGLSFIRKEKDDKTLYFITNLADNFSRGMVNLSREFTNIELLDPLTGQKYIIKSSLAEGKTLINLHLEPGRSCFLFCDNNKPKKTGRPDESEGQEKILSGLEWTLTPLSAGDKLPLTIKTDKLISWTEFGGNWQVYSGKVLYSAEFEMDESQVGKKMLIDLGDTRETARIRINDTEIGLLWCIPYKISIPEKIIKKRNKIEIEVTNLSFNKVIDLDRKGVPWKQFHEINFVNIRYLPYDASDKEPVLSGLLSEIKLIPINDKQ